MSDASTAQIKITLPNELYLHLKSKTDKFGLTMAAYIKNLILNDVKDIDIPVFKMGQKREKIALKALEDYKKGKTKILRDLDNYLESLT